MDAINANFLRKGTKRSGIALKQRTEKAADNSACPSILGPTNTGNNGWWTVQPQSELSGKPESIKDFITEALWQQPPRLGFFKPGDLRKCASRTLTISAWWVGRRSVREFSHQCCTVNDMAVHFPFEGIATNAA
jgi:hypothetical protein